jgi:hypothetical protein
MTNPERPLRRGFAGRKDSGRPVRWSNVEEVDRSPGRRPAELLEAARLLIAGHVFGADGTRRSGRQLLSQVPPDKEPAILVFDCIYGGIDSGT